MAPNDSMGGESFAAIKTLKVLGMGNPVMDMLVDVDQAFLDKYNIKLNNAILVEESHLSMYGEAKTMTGMQYIPGGATQNTIRVCNALMRQSNATAFIGCIGNDEIGNEMIALSKTEGFTGLYTIDEKLPTGICLVAVMKGERSLATRLGAANEYSHADAKTRKDIADAIRDAQIIYSSGYFCTVAVDAMVEVAKSAAETNKIYSLNFAAPFVVSAFKSAVQQLIPYCDYIFGNESEFLEFAKSFQLETTDIKIICEKIVCMDKVNKKRKRVVICTQGDMPTVVATTWCGEGVRVTEYPVKKVVRILDTNGAGDAFVGGYLYALSHGMNEEMCIFYSNYAAAHVIQRSGCTFDFADIPHVENNSIEVRN